MSGENIYNLLAAPAPKGPGYGADKQQPSQYTGKYEKHTEEASKPVYSTFFEKGKEYDGSNVRFFKQRDAVIGKNVSDTVDPNNFLKKGEGIRAVVPPIHKEKVYTKPTIDDRRAGGEGLDGPQGPYGNGAGGYPNSVGGAPGAGFGSGEGGNDGQGPDGAGGLGAGGRGAGGLGASGQGASGLGAGCLDAGGLGVGGLGAGGLGAGGLGAGGLGAGGLGAGGLGAGGTYAGFQGYNNFDEGMGVSKSRKNFIASNIVEVSNMVPKNRKDQPKLATDGKDFGKTPVYLERVKQEVGAEKSFMQALDSQKTQRRQQIYDQYVYMLSPNEQAHLLSTLKGKLQEKSTALARIPLSRDTASITKKKSELERSIKDIESAIAKLEKEAIFIYKDDPVNGQWTKNAALEEAKKYVLSTAPA